MKHTVDKKIIGFDMDGVIIDHTRNKIVVSKKFGFNVEKEQTPSDIMREVLPAAAWDKIQVILFDDPNVSLTPRLMPGVKNVLENLKRNRTPFFLISRRKSVKPALRLLKKRKLWPHYFNETNAFFVKSKEEKDLKSAELGITDYFDDQHSVLDKLISVKHKFLFDHLGVFKNSGYTRVQSWKDISKLL